MVAIAMASWIAVLFVCNVVWFGLGALQFGFRSGIAARGILHRDAWQTPALDVVAGSLRFLGGLNASLMILSATALALGLETLPPVWGFAICGCIALAHASQFLVNIPIASAEARGRPAVWRVLRGPMLWIFIIDGLLAGANAAAALSFVL